MLIKDSNTPRMQVNIKDMRNGRSKTFTVYDVERDELVHQIKAMIAAKRDAKQKAECAEVA